MKLLDLVPVTTLGIISPAMENYINKYLSTDTKMDVELDHLHACSAEIDRGMH